MKTQTSHSKSPRGRRPAGAQTREAIAVAARRQFSEQGYRDTTLRSVATEAGVDHRLVLHYFGSKRELFMSAIELPVAPETFLERVFEGDPEHLSERVARALVATLEEPDSQRSALAIIRAAASEPEAADIIRAVLSERVLTPLVTRIDADHPELRATMVATQFVGMAMARYVVGVEPLASASPEQIVRAITPVIEHYLTGDWVGNE